MGWLTSIRGLGARADRGRVLMLAAVVLLAAVGGGALLLRASAPAVPSEALSAPRFVDVTEAAGVEHAFRGADEFAGGGVAALDCDADGRPELYLAGGTAPAALFHNDSPVGGDLRFSRIADPATDITGVTGAYPVDVDGDEVLDLGVLRRGENVLLRGLGDCRFERANEKWSFDGDGEQAEWTTAFSATWEGSAALPTLAFGNYRDGASTDPADLCFDNVLVRPDSSQSRLRLWESTSTSSSRPTAASCSSDCIRFWSPCSSDSRRLFSASSTSSGIRLSASVFGRGEYLNENMLWKRTRSTSDSVSSKSEIVSPGNPTIISVDSAIPGTVCRAWATSSR